MSLSETTPSNNHFCNYFNNAKNWLLSYTLEQNIVFHSETSSNSYHFAISEILLQLNIM